MFSLDHLSATEFEEFCYDLLSSLGYRELSWRKGTGLDASPSDQGRDLEAVEEVREPGGKIRLDRWFVECKHHKRGVPPERIQGALAWAGAESPDYLLFICSNFLSNPAKNYLERYARTNKPGYKVRVWERKNLEALCAGKTKLLHKFKLPSDIPGLDHAHPNHLTYVLSPQLNSLGFLFECLEQLDPGRRDLALGSVYYELVSPRFREPIHPNETLAELMLGSMPFLVETPRGSMSSRDLREAPFEVRL